MVTVLVYVVDLVQADVCVVVGILEVAGAVAEGTQTTIVSVNPVVTVFVIVAEPVQIDVDVVTGFIVVLLKVGAGLGDV